MLATTIVGSLPKPGWLATPGVLWALWQLAGAALEEGKRDAVLLALREQEDASLDVVSDGEQSRQHFIHTFVAGLEGIDFSKRVTKGIFGPRYLAQVPSVTGPIRRPRSAHAEEVRFARAHTRKQLKFALPGPMTIVDGRR
jgi:5-methyltetrahydropteroyltriglutamate--homocysteine methyltransferase